MVGEADAGVAVVDTEPASLPTLVESGKVVSVTLVTGGGVGDEDGGSEGLSVGFLEGSEVVGSSVGFLVGSTVGG